MKPSEQDQNANLTEAADRSARRSYFDTSD